MTTVGARTELAALLADDAAVDALVGGAELPALLPALAHLTAT